MVYSTHLSVVISLVCSCCGIHSMKYSQSIYSISILQLIK